MDLKEQLLKMKANSNPNNTEDEWELEKKAEKEQKLKEKLETFLDAKYINTTFNDFIILPENQKTINLIKEWLRNYKAGRWLVIKGNQGTGKTMLKNIIMKELYINHRVKPYSTTLYSLYIDYLDTMRIGDTKKMINSLGYSKMLVIDEIGRRESTTALKDFVFEVMDRLYLNGGSAILITNDTTKGYIDQSRLKEVGISLGLTGEDQRSKRC